MAKEIEDNLQLLRESKHNTFEKWASFCVDGHERWHEIENYEVEIVKLRTQLGYDQQMLIAAEIEELNEFLQRVGIKWLRYAVGSVGFWDQISVLKDKIEGLQVKLGLYSKCSVCA